MAVIEGWPLDRVGRYGGFALQSEWLTVQQQLINATRKTKEEEEAEVENKLPTCET